MVVNRHLGMLDMMMMTGGFVGMGMKQENKKTKKTKNDNVQVENGLLRIIKKK